MSDVWGWIAAHQGQTFYTKKGLPVTYYIKGGELFCDRRERSITRSTFEKAWEKMQAHPDTIRGPRALNVYGAPYVWTILSAMRDEMGIEE